MQHTKWFYNITNYGMVILFLLALLSACNSPVVNSAVKSEDGSSKVITVLDVNGDTLCAQVSFHLDSLGCVQWNARDTVTITFEEYLKWKPYILLDDMMIIRICSGIVHMGELAFVKKEFRERGGRQAKYDFVSDIDWTEVSAGDISCKPVLWGMVYGNEFFNAYDSAVRQHWSWAEFFMHWEKRSAQQEISKDYLKQAQDSLFRAEDEPFTYGLSWNRAEEISFRIVDLNMVMDWDDDGYSDRILRWYAEQGSGICWVTRKGVDQQIDFFEVKDAKEK